MNCKCKSPEFWKGPTLVVFTDFLTLDYYDGPTTMVCKCAACGSANLVSVISWEPTLTPVRVFGVAGISLGQFRKIEGHLFIQERMVSAGISDRDNDYVSALSELIRESPPPEIVLASDNLPERIIAARHVTEVSVTFKDPTERVSGEDLYKWLSYLGILS